MIYIKIKYQNGDEKEVVLNPNWAERKFKALFPNKASREVTIVAETDKAYRIKNTITNGQWLPKTAFDTYVIARR